MLSERFREVIDEVEKLRKEGESTAEFQLLIYDLIELIGQRTTEEERRLMALAKEVDIIESHNQSQIYEIKNIDESIEKLKPILEDRAQVLSRLNDDVKKNREKITETTKELERIEDALEVTKERTEELRKLIEDIETSMTHDRKVAEQKYSYALEKMKNITSHYPLMHFLLTTTLENIPEAELMVVIGSNQPVEESKIKTLCRSVPPVQIKRHLVKLQGDELIEQDREDKWKVAESFLAKVQRDPFEKFQYIEKEQVNQ